MVAGDADRSSGGLWYEWDDDSLGMRPPLGAVSPDNMRQCFTTRGKVQAQLSGANVCLILHSLGIINHALREHRPKRGLVTPHSFLQAIKLRCILPGLLPSLDGLRVKRWLGFSLVENDGLNLLLLWLIVHTMRGDIRQRDATQDGLQEAKLERVSSECRHVEGVKVAAHPSGRVILGKKRRDVKHIGNQFPTGRPHDAGYVSAVAAVPASTINVEGGSAPP